MMGKLCSCVLLLFFAIKLRDSLVCAKMFSAVYTVPAEGNPETYIRCGFSLMKQSQYVGAKVTDSTGECVGLTKESIHSTQPESGHGLMYKNIVQEKTKDNLDASETLVKTQELFQPPVQVSRLWAWRIHEFYGIISAIEIALTFPMRPWDWIKLNLANEVKGGHFTTYARVPINVGLEENTSSAKVNDRYNGSWATPLVAPYPKTSLTGVTSKLKLVGLFDDEEWFLFADRRQKVEPAIIKQFNIHLYGGGVVLVHNATLFGTCN